MKLRQIAAIVVVLGFLLCGFAGPVRAADFNKEDFAAAEMRTDNISSFHYWTFEPRTVNHIDVDKNLWPEVNMTDFVYMKECDVWSYPLVVWFSFCNITTRLDGAIINQTNTNVLNPVFYGTFATLQFWVVYPTPINVTAHTYLNITAKYFYGPLSNEAEWTIVMHFYTPPPPPSPPSIFSSTGDVWWIGAVTGSMLIFLPVLMAFGWRRTDGVGKVKLVVIGGTTMLLLYVITMVFLPLG